MNQNMVRMGTLLLLLTIALSAIGVGYALWTKTLSVEGIVHTGEVDVEFVDAFTDDDGQVDNVNKDSQDDGGPSQGFDKWGSESSADPAASGRDPKDHFDEDVAKCEASHDGNERGRVEKSDVYPGYFCTAWFDIRNVGNIPVKIKSVTITIDEVATTTAPSVTTPYDLDGDNKPDVNIHISEIQLCQQIEPNDVVQMNIDQEILQDADQDEELEYSVEVLLAQWNEVGDSDSNGDNVCDSA